MKSIFISTLILLSSMACEKAFGQDFLENSLLWKIEGNGLEKASYLMGTIHIMCEEDFEMKDKFETAIKETENLVLEVNFSDPKEMASMQSALMSDEKLTDKLSSGQADTLNTILAKSLSGSIEAYNSYSLMAIYSMLLNQSIPCESKKMYEFELMALANYYDKPIHGLETLADQSDFFNKAFPTDFLIKQIVLLEEYGDVFSEMVKYYNEENLEKLFSVLDDERFMNKEAEYWMLEHRNKNWGKKIPEMMHKGSNLFAVGSAHLAGEFGMIKMLRDQGFDVTPVFN